MCANFMPNFMPIQTIMTKTDGKQKIKKEAETLSNQEKSYLMKKDESASFARGG